MRWVRVCVLLVFSIMQVIAMQEVQAAAISGAGGSQADPTSKTVFKREEASLVINLPARTISLYDNDQLINEYPIAIGDPQTPTPLGIFSVYSKEVNPDWYPPGKDWFIPSGPNNPLGYRWIAFYSTYGIHGTNMPSSIGGAVSNGCIRMFEPDVEELFERVPLGTLVKVVYERVGVQIGQDGSFAVHVYPDVYGIKPLSFEAVKQDIYQKAAQAGLADWIYDEQLVKIKELYEKGNAAAIKGRLFRLRIDGIPVSGYGVQVDEVKYVPVMAIARAIGATVREDDQGRFVYGENGRFAPSMKQNGKYVTGIFITESDVQKLFPGTVVWVEEFSKAGTYAFNYESNRTGQKAPAIYLDGLPAEIEARWLDGMLVLPSLPLAAALNKQTVWDDKSRILDVAGQQHVVRSYQGKPYLEITQVEQVMGIQVYWNTEAGKIELTLPKS